ncbi:MerR family transcriptional regulator [Streptomyces sp. OE57]|uniref:MerR family transcriptional regulator n=1 Tax=Streptomyces lacaronensis TaxID=3379885 RepID=UPI0039B7239E
MRIGEPSRATGVSARSLRYYEEQGLRQSRRRANAYREYPEAVQQVAFIQDLLSAGLPSQVIRGILPCAWQAQPQGDCAPIGSTSPTGRSSACGG